MRFHTLLEDLIDVSKTRKADLADALSYSPGELSRFLSGQRLPPVTNAEYLVGAAADFFTDAIWDKGLSFGLRKIFPLRLAFADKNDLHTALKNALAYALQLSYSERQDENRLYCGAQNVLRGWSDILNRILIRMSTALRFGRELQCYITMDLFWHLLINQTVQVLDNGDNLGRIHIHVLMTEEDVARNFDLNTIENIIERVQRLSPLMYFTIWKTSQPKPKMFMMLGDDTLLFVNDLIKDLPLATLIQDKVYIMHFLGFCRQLFETKLSYAGEQIPEFAGAHRDDILKAASECEGIFLFCCVALVFQSEDLAGIEAAPEGQALLHEICQTLWERPIPLIWTTKVQDQLLTKMEVILPTVGHVTLTSKTDLECLAYRLEALRTDNIMQMGIISHEAPHYALFVLKDDIVIYLPGSKTNKECFTLLPKAACKYCLDDLERLVTRNLQPTHTDLLENYMRSLRTR